MPRRVKAKSLRLSLKARLTFSLILLLALGLGSVEVLTYVSLKSFLSQRLSAQIATARLPIERFVRLKLAKSVTIDPNDLDQISNPGVFIEILSSNPLVNPTWTENGGILVFPSGPSDNPDPTPELPKILTLSHRVKKAGFLTDRIPESGLSSYVVGAIGHPHFKYQVEVTRLTEGSILVVAAPLAPTQITLQRLVGIEVALSVTALAILFLLGLWIVGIGLKPLGGMAEQADAIASGELSRRVEPADDRSEVGRLGKAINVMLGRIEIAFKDRESSEERLRRFIADASHELRTPLTSIRGYAELFRRGAANRPDDLRRAMSRIESEAERMGVLVDDLLLLARLDQGRELELEKVDLGLLAADAVFDGQAVKPDREFRVSTEGDCVVEGDEFRLRQMIANLVRNAYFHTPEGTPISVSVARSEENEVEVEVHDDGPGIPQESIEKIFERFYRAPGATQNGSFEGGPEGHGLGLSIVAAIARAHKGRVWAESGLGHGTSVFVAIPVVPKGANTNDDT